jgi:hypothetical protein
LRRMHFLVFLRDLANAGHSRRKDTGRFLERLMP